MNRTELRRRDRQRRDTGIAIQPQRREIVVDAAVVVAVGPGLDHGRAARGSRAVRDAVRGGDDDARRDDDAGALATRDLDVDDG